jgi:branched-chain amino acid transport system permease protein
MTAVDVAATARPNPLAVLGRLKASPLFQPIAVVAVLLLALFYLPTFGEYWVRNFTFAAIFTVLAASAGMLYGRVGLVSLGQVAPFGIGVWVTMRLAFSTNLPYPVLMLVAGLAATLIGVLIGLPALRVSGLYLALVSLMLVAALEILLGELKFPNGGPGFRGLDPTLSEIIPMRRPTFAESTVGYYRFAVIAAFCVLMLAAAILARKPGRAWASIRQSEAAAITAGIDVTRYKVWAFALASFMAGIAGSVYAGLIPSGMDTSQFNRQAAIFLIAAVIMGGIYSLWGGVLAAFFAAVFLKFLTQNVIGHDFWESFNLSLFGFGLLMNLVQSSKAADKKGVQA